MYCAGVTTSLEQLWDDLIDNEYREHGDNVVRIVENVAAVAQPHRAKNAEIPLGKQEAGGCG